MEEKISSSNVQVATVTSEFGYKILKEEELAPIVSNL